MSIVLLFLRQPAQTVQPPVLGGGVVFAPVIGVAQVVTVGLIRLAPPASMPLLLNPDGGGSFLLTPTVSVGVVTVSPDILGGGVIYAPNVALASALGLIDQSGLAFAPTVSSVASVFPDVLGGGSLFDPVVTLAVGSQTVEPPVLGGGSVFDPVIGGIVQAPSVGSGRRRRHDLFFPSNDQLVSVARLGGSHLFTPVVSVSDDLIVLGLTDDALLGLVLA